MQKRQQTMQRPLFPFGHQLYAAVEAISNPAAEAPGIGLSDGVVAKINSLHAAVYTGMETYKFFAHLIVLASHHSAQAPAE